MIFTTGTVIYKTWTLIFTAGTEHRVIIFLLKTGHKINMNTIQNVNDEIVAYKTVQLKKKKRLTFIKIK